MQPVRKKILMAFVAIFMLSACNTSGTSQSPQDSAAMGSDQDGSMMEGEWTEEEMKMMEEEGHSMEMEAAGSEAPQDELAAQTDGRYLTYSAQTAEELAASGTPHVIFFHADWCSWCRRMDKDLKAEIGTFSENAKVLKANFDKETELRQKYGVTIKDSYAFIGSQGETVAVKSGATLDDPKEFFASSTVSDEVVENPTGVAMYRDYDTDIEKTFIGKKPYALFFHAEWCPQCRKIDEEIKANFDSLPGSVAIFKTDFDTAVELRKKYGVTTQHTLVHVDANGEVTEVLPGFTLEDAKRVFTQ